MIDHDEELVGDPTYPTDYTISLFSKEGRSEIVTDARHLHDELRKIGLEWKTADWAHRQTVVITVAPITPATNPKVAFPAFPAEAICPVHGRVSLRAEPTLAFCSYDAGHLPGSNGALMTRGSNGVINYVNGARPVESHAPTMDDIMQQARERITPVAKKAARTLTEFLLK